MLNSSSKIGKLKNSIRENLLKINDCLRDCKYIELIEILTEYYKNNNELTSLLEQEFFYHKENLEKLTLEVKYLLEQNKINDEVFKKKFEKHFKDFIIFKPLRIITKLNELRNMKDGWSRIKSLTPKSKDLDWLENSFKKYFSDDLPLPNIYPVKDGVQIEWCIGPYTISLYINLETHYGEWCYFKDRTDEGGARDFNLEDEYVWKWIVVELYSLTNMVKKDCLVDDFSTI